MDISSGIKKIEISQEYRTEIFGLGEVYEMMSVERIRKRLSRKFQGGTLYLSSNIGHLRGMTLNDLVAKVSESGSAVLEKGYADSPPFPSKPRSKENRRNCNPIIISVAKIIFFFLVRLEFLREGSTNSHMIYCFTQK